MKNILLLAHDDGGQEARLQCALDLTRAVGGHLTCLDVTRTPLPVQDYVTSTGYAIALFEEEERELRNAARLKQRLEQEDVAWDWAEMIGPLAECLESQAGFADVVVLSTSLPAGQLSDIIEAASDLLMRTRRLIMAVPPDAKRFDMTGTAVIAWDGSGPAQEAVRQVLPIMTQAASVLAVTADDRRGAETGEELLAYLSRHGVKATLERRDDSRNPPDEQIRQACRDHQASYCVMGAYGHSRRVQAWLGGVTRRMLASSEVPLFLAH